MRTLSIILGVVTIVTGIAVRYVMIRFGLVNGYVENGLPLTCIGIGVPLLFVKNRILRVLLVIAAVLTLGLIGLLVAIAGAAPYAR